MSKIQKKLNEFFYAWGDNDPEQEVLRNGKLISLKKLYEYDDYKYFRPRRATAGAVIIAGGIMGSLGLGVTIYQGVSYLKDKHEESKADS